MSEKLSALMDGELEHDEASGIIKSMSSNDAHRECWDTFHLIGDAMRGQGHPCKANIGALFERLSREPTVLAPVAVLQQPGRNERRTRIALAMAASVATVSVISMIAMKSNQNATVAPVQLVQRDAPKAIAETPMVNVNDYLAIHRQFSNPAGLQQASVMVATPMQTNRQANGK